MLIGKDGVGNSHFVHVGIAREDLEARHLSLPAELANNDVSGERIGHQGDSPRRLGRKYSFERGDTSELQVRNVVEVSQPKEREAAPLRGYRSRIRNNLSAALVAVAFWMSWDVVHRANAVVLSERTTPFE